MTRATRQANQDTVEYECSHAHADEATLTKLRNDALSNDRLTAMAAFMSATGNETRLRMLYVLWRATELCVCDLADIFEITQPAVSRHLKILKEKSLVEARREAQTVFYHVNPESPFGRLLVRAFEEQDTEDIVSDVAEAAKLVPKKWPQTDSA